MNDFITGSPNSDPHAPANPPPKPLVPAIPTRQPPTSTTTPSPSRTRTPAASITFVTACSSIEW